MTKLPPKVAKACFIRDEWKCRSCRNRNDLHPHHVTYRSQQGKHELNNLLTLCWKCHEAKHRGDLQIMVIETLAFDLRVRFIRIGGWKP